jgi:hypothetical protein
VICASFIKLKIKIIYKLKKYIDIKMGNSLRVLSHPVEPTSVRNIIINQATCHGCNTLLSNRGVCKCGNVEIYGDNVELGRKVKNEALYSDCSLLEYVRK